ncbi:hypothetical protein, partial [Pararhodobacter sp. SW119]|uniref:hypothetical protein n=1 Tax=Pararhodobacter sp. SW119 TaxID=2780075 RepID=UPI001ADED5E3
SKAVHLPKSFSYGVFDFCCPASRSKKVGGGGSTADAETLRCARIDRGETLSAWAIIVASISHS